MASALALIVPHGAMRVPVAGQAATVITSGAAPVRARKGCAMPALDYTLVPIGVLRSPLTRREDAPMQGREGAPDAWLEVSEPFVAGLEGIAVGDEVIIITWLHLAQRDVLRVHPRGDESRPLAGVFGTRSPDRPNPLGLHPVTVREVAGARLKVGPIEAIDGTPVVDIKTALKQSAGA
jgi:tRNA-Thr(GGU) m(6)t(6)A37 methyltransferase TsaA